MIEAKRINLPDTVPPAVMKAWREGQQCILVIDDDIPAKVLEFIDAVADELGDFEQHGKYTVLISGVELSLANIKKMGNEIIVAHNFYPIDVPVMIAVNHRNAMKRLYKKRGKHGLIDYCRAKCEPKKIRSIIEILNMHVFNG
jgi:hypothetical protein